MTKEAAEQNRFEGWAIVEIFGHQKYAGFVSTQVFGTACMFRVDVPALEERERVTTRPGYINGRHAPAGSKVEEGAVQGYSKLFGVGAIYALTPCTEAAAMAAVEEIQPRPLRSVELPVTAAAAIAAPARRTCCGCSPEDDDEGCACSCHDEGAF